MVRRRYRSLTRWLRASGSEGLPPFACLTRHPDELLAEPFLRERRHAMCTRIRRARPRADGAGTGFIHRRIAPGAMATWRQYRISVDFHVPLSFAYRWCTDYTPEDGEFSGEDRTIHLERRIIDRSPGRVEFENLYDQGGGWGWERHVVTLRPPDRWHCVGRGNYHESILDYQLVPLTDRSTRLNMVWRSRPVGVAPGPRPARPAVQRHVTGLWKRRARALELEYRSRLRTRTVTG